MSQTSVNSKAFTTTAGTCPSTTYWGGTVVSGATATVVKIRRGTVSGAIVDIFTPAISRSENHALAVPIAVPEGIFVDVDANTANAIIWFE